LPERQEAIRWCLQNGLCKRKEKQMKNTLTLLIASTAISVALGLPAWSALRGPSDLFSAVFSDIQGAANIVLAGDDDGDSDSRRAGRNDDDDEEEGCGRSANGRCAKGNNPAPVGTAPPPKNGLFGTGAAPKAQMN